MTWREFIEEHEGDKDILKIVNKEFAKIEGRSYDDEMPSYVLRMAENEADRKLGKALGNALSDDVIDRLLKEGSVNIKISL